MNHLQSSQMIYMKCQFFYFYFFFLFGFYSPFKNISLISSGSFIKGGRKPENPGGKKCQNFFFSEKTKNKKTIKKLSAAVIISALRGKGGLWGMCGQSLHTRSFTVCSDISLLIRHHFQLKSTGPSCSKLTTSLVNVSLKFTPSDTQICWNFLLKKCE